MLTVLLVFFVSCIFKIQYKMNTLTSQVGLYTDLYELTMAQAYYVSRKHNERAVFDYFFRTCPFDGGYTVFAGLADLLNILKKFKYNKEDRDYLKKIGLREDFVEWLANFEVKADIYSVREGEIVFPNEPILRVEGTLIETQLIETIILNYINFQSLIATKAARIAYAADGRVFSDFGLRRAQGLGGIHASRAAVIGGAKTTSNVYAGFNYNIPVTGTIAHSWIQSFDREIDAFRKYAEINPDSTVLLVDTYDTLQSGMPNAIKVAKELEANGHKLIGVRLDSGDFAYLSKKVRKMLNKAGLGYVKILVSNQLNEHVIKSLLGQGAEIDAFGVGTDLVTAKGTPALDGVYKLSECDGTPRMKISENIEKNTLPGRKKIYRYFDKCGKFYADGILLHEEQNCKNIQHAIYYQKKSNVKEMHFEEIQQQVMKDGEICVELSNANEAHNYFLERFELLNDEHKRFLSPHIYKVGISSKIKRLKEKLYIERKRNYDI